MSRIGNKEVTLPTGVEVKLGPASMEVKGPKGQLSFPLFPEVSVEIGDGRAVVKRTGSGSERKSRALHGLVRAHLANMVTGVTDGFEKSLVITGTGWNAKVQGQGVEMQIGYCHPVVMNPPEGVTVEVPSPQEIVVRGADKQAVGQFAANLRRVRPPEPYKGKGIRFKDEQVRRKVGKSLA